MRVRQGSFLFLFSDEQIPSPELSPKRPKSVQPCVSEKTPEITPYWTQVKVCRVRRVTSQKTTTAQPKPCGSRKAVAQLEASQGGHLGSSIWGLL